jgi:UDP-glucose 4-epimerase
MNVLVTGGLGFIGSNLVDKLIHSGYSVDVIDNMSSIDEAKKYCQENNIKWTWQIENEKANYYNGNIVDIFEILGDKQYDKIFHLAAKARIQPSFDNPLEWFESNSLGTMKVLEYAKQTKSGIVVYATTSSKTHGHYISPYTYTKIIGEGLLKLYYKCYGLNCAMATFYNVYGHREPEYGEWATVVAKFIRQYNNGEPITVVGDGQQSRDFTHVDDVCNGLLKISDGKWAADNFDLGRGKPIKILDLAMMVCDGEEDNIKHTPLRKNEGKHTESNWKETENRLGWRAKNNLPDYIELKTRKK